MKKIKLNAIQYRLWIDNSLKYPSSEYNDTNYTFVATGDLSISRLKEAYRLILLEYPPFYSTLLVENDTPYFLPDDTFNQPPLSLLESSSAAETEERIEELVGRPFDLRREYPCRFYAIRQGDKWYLLHLFHHIVIDGLTMGSFFERLAAIYNQLSEGNYQPADQTAEMMAFNAAFDGSYSRQKRVTSDYWMGYIRNFPARLPIPLLSGPASEAVAYEFKLGNMRYESVQELCRRLHTTPFRIYAATWALTLSKAMRVSQLLLDHTVNLRPKDSSLFGVFVNNLPIKYDLGDENRTFREIITYLYRNREAEREHPYAFYNDILRQPGNGERQPERINAGINYPIRYKSFRLDLRDCEVAPHTHINVPLSMDLVLAIEDDKEGNCYIRHQPPVSPELVRTLADLFRQLLSQAVRDPEIRIKDFRLLSEERQTRLLREEEEMLHRAVPVQTFLPRFRQQALDHPHHPAVVFDDNTLTYEELDKQSDRVAASLLDRHLSRQRVGLSTPKNSDMLVGILGILKAGSTYVPIDHQLPADRIRFMVEDCQIAAVLVTDETPEQAREVPRLSIHELRQWQGADKPHLPEPTPSQEAYIIYTSGTTGKPKGIPIKHAMLYQTIVTNSDLFHLDTRSRVIQFANICFDASILEIFPTLTAGATVVVPREEIRKDPALLLSFIETQGITTFCIPPVLLANLPQRHLPLLSTIVLGGDSTSQEAIRYWSRDRLFINSYGPAENTVDATYSMIYPDSPVNDIGRTLPGVTCYVLDKHLHLVPDYVIGELYIGGVKLTEGYINRPALNAEKFIPNPYVSPEDRRRGINLRLYKSGDLVMRRKDGHLLFIGRTDFQIKLRGYRIEPGDIESKIMAYSPAARDAVATVYEQADRKRLIAYVQIDAPERFSTESLRTFLHGVLPTYMIPSIIIPLKEFPYNTSGKVDRKRLPTPTLPTLNERKQTEKPATATEQRVASLWQTLLPGQEIGRKDTFIALGGDSIAVIRLSFALEKQFGISVKASDIYAHPTLKELAAFLDTRLSHRKEKRENEERISPAGHQPIPLSPVQFSLWLQCAQSDAVKDSYNLPCIFECPARTCIETFEKAFNRLVQTQESFRLSFPTDDRGIPHIAVAEYRPLTVETQAITSEELSKCLSRDMEHPFVLTKAPLFRCVLYHVDNQRYICSLVMHHLISDGWSAQLIQSFLEHALAGDERDEKRSSGSYTAYSIEEHRFMETAKYAKRLRHWERLPQELSDLPLLSRKPGTPEAIRGAAYACPLPRQLQEASLQFCRRHACTPFVLYGSVYLLLLARLSQQRAFAIGFPSSGRERSDYDQVIGYFVHTLPLCHRSGYDKLSFRQYIAAVRQELIAAEENAVSLDKIVEIARSRTGIADLQLIQTLFSVEDHTLFYDYVVKKNAAFRLAMTILTNQGKSPVCYVEYQCSHFSEEEIRRITSAYLDLLEAVVENPERSVTSYSLASKEYRQSVIAANSLSGAYPKALSPFLAHFAAAVQANPQQTALVGEETRLTYEELDQRSDRIAATIKQSGIKTPAAVALCMQASIDCIITLVGILKAGCCYVPIDTEAPEKRRRFIEEDASCRLLFSEKNYPQGICLPTDRQESDLSPDCAYIIYTSGTTGVPKGVPITQQALSNLIETERTRFALTPDSRVLLFSSIGFDASVTEIFTTLSTGATLVIATSAQRRDPELLANLLEAKRITCATIPPAMLPLLPRRDYPALSTLIVGGESTALSALTYWSKERTLINAYGPTENTVDTSLCRVDQSFEPNDIGLPLPGVSCYVLDAHLNIVPCDMPGELYIGGIQLTDGYLRRPELNQEKFIANPYVTPEDKANQINTRLYRSGDLVTRRMNGHLIFLGRIDNQVKLHGFRIELSEIETQLQQDEHVRHALVEIRKRGRQEELVAFVQPRSHTDIDISALQQALRDRLPAYMIPTKWAIVKEFPLTVNGKIDRKRLPEPHIALQNTIVPPANEEEKLMLSEAQAILDTEAIGVETDLPDTGMTSMQIMEFVARLSGKSRSYITISAVYKHRTIRQLAQAGEENRLLFWANSYSPQKPVLLLVCGYPYFHPSYDIFVERLRDHFSILVLESHNAYFRDKARCTLDDLLDAYVNLLRPVLKDKKLFGATGLCLGGEIALQLAVRLDREHIAQPKVFVIDGFADRDTLSDSGFIEEPGVTPEINAMRNRISDQLAASFHFIPYKGETHICLAGQFTKRLRFENQPEETDPEILAAAYQRFQANAGNWKRRLPNGHLHTIHATHWNILKAEGSEEIKKIILFNID